MGSHSFSMNMSGSYDPKLGNVPGDAPPSYQNFGYQQPNATTAAQVIVNQQPQPFQPFQQQMPQPHPQFNVNQQPQPFQPNVGHGFSGHQLQEGKGAKVLNTGEGTASSGSCNCWCCPKWLK